MKETDMRRDSLLLLDRFKLHNREIEAGVAKGLTDAGFVVDIVPGIGLNVYGEPVPEGSIIAVYRKGGTV